MRREEREEEKERENMIDRYLPIFSSDLSIVFKEYLRHSPEAGCG